MISIMNQYRTVSNVKPKKKFDQIIFKELNVELSQIINHINIKLLNFVQNQIDHFRSNLVIK